MHETTMIVKKGETIPSVTILDFWLLQNGDLYLIVAA